MSGQKTKKLRKQFEAEKGFGASQRKDEIYKHYWRKFKKGER
jgi:hypothetical protein